MTRILACIDASSYTASVCDLAAWAANRLDATIEILHVHQRKDAVAARHDLSGAIGLGVKSELLEELTRIDEEEGRLARQKGRLLLASAEERLRAAGVVKVTPLHRHGGIVETIIEREAEADLVVIGKRGASGEFAIEHIGSKIERVVRSSVKPVKGFLLLLHVWHRCTLGKGLEEATSAALGGKTDLSQQPFRSILFTQ